ncbi:MAG TPA: thiamine pyrophosphate-binding protein [Gammaproteobacteria bacterium]|nr:thiamine pyrophosphate-binding protein [Gammaproteobacteria bacterium]
MKASEYLIKSFMLEGVNHLFMVPGGHVDNVMAALEKFPDFQGIVAGHEGGAAMMADGYSKVSGKFGVALGIGGPGITNMMTGITTALSDQTPLFVITGDPAIALQGRGTFQDTSPSGFNANTFLDPVTNKHLSVYHADALESQVNLLCRNMLGMHRGPVQLSISSDVQKTEVECKPIKLPELLYHPRFLDHSAAQETGRYFKGSTKIAILAGAGSLHSDATDALVKFAETYEIPVATTLGGKSVFPENHRLSLGVFGWFGNPRAMETILSDDLEVLIVLGSHLNQMSTVKWSPKFLPKKALIINDIDAGSYFGNFRPDLFVLGDAKTYLENLIQSAEDNLEKSRAARKKWVDKITQINPNFYDTDDLTKDAVPLYPARVIKALRDVMPKNTILFSGEGATGFCASHYWTCYGPGQHFTQVKSMSPMGWSIAAAIGGKFAKPDVPVVSIIGDGSMLMHGLEIQTAARYNLPVIFVSMDNGAHGNPQLRARQVGKFETEFLNLPHHDWVKIAEGLGLVGIVVEKPEQLKPAFERALKLNKAVLIHIKVGNYSAPVKFPPV